MKNNLKERYTKIAEREECKNVAFWRYDHFPHVLGSPVTQINVKEDCTVNAYSPAYGGYVKPQYMTTSVADAIDVLDKLESLGYEYAEAQRKLHAEYVAKAKNIAPYLSKIIDGK